MPTIFKFGRYVIYFLTNEGEPREPLHVHVSVGRASPNATKLWITSTGEVIVCNNNSQIPIKGLNRIISAVKTNIPEITEEWLDHFGEITYIS